jgi:Flp pilus assembly protein TadD
MEPAGTQSLRRAIERSLRAAFDEADVLPRLARLARLAEPGSDDGIFANQKLAELLVERQPWRAALYVRRAIAHRGGDDRLWAILAFCQTLLGNFRCALRAYESAIRCAPANPWYAHNLGHLLDVALGDPARAVPWLRSAHEAKEDNSEIVASYIHALARAGKVTEARRVLERARARFASRELDALLRWLDQGAPSGQVARKRRKPSAMTPKRLARVLTHGLSHLPLDPLQCERALALARDALPSPRRRRAAVTGAARGAQLVVRRPLHDAPPEAAGPRPNRLRGGDSTSPHRLRGGERDDDVVGLAAAVAYAIVYVDHVPLSQAEVAAPFRVGVAHLRGRFAELRAKLDIIRGDARYATTRH